MTPLYFSIHGHFYQPPRENPWTEQIEPQPSAKPFHDWNERINAECYRPNAQLGNFRFLSFNVGPTLMSWLELHDREVYEKIIEADRESVARHSGHGHAIAQVYNHMILPLAREQEARTQIEWGIFDFKQRFGRPPEGMWLPETAASLRTLDQLIEAGIQFTILAPEQAEKVRPLEGGAPARGIRQADTFRWQDVSHGSIDPTFPYRSFHSRDPGRSLDIFFFDGPLSRDVSFGDLLGSPKKLAERFQGAHRDDRPHPELIQLASDGETFGHHKKGGEKTIALFFNEEAQKHGFRPTNYGEFLEKFPPQYEVKIKSGEGTSWSCSHGVGRWKENCGCHTGGGPGWNQKWRKPLRRAVEFLEEKISALYEREGRGLFKDPWAARDGFIQLILSDTPESQNDFFGRHGLRELSREERLQAIKLLQMTRFAMLSETSCGWFFNDLAGIETVQILRYALRSLEIAAEMGEPGLEADFVKILKRAQSNQPEYGDGQTIWEKLVKPSGVIW